MSNLQNSGGQVFFKDCDVILRVQACCSLVQSQMKKLAPLLCNGWLEFRCQQVIQTALKKAFNDNLIKCLSSRCKKAFFQHYTRASILAAWCSALAPVNSLMHQKGRLQELHFAIWKSPESPAFPWGQRLAILRGHLYRHWGP